METMNAKKSSAQESWEVRPGGMLVQKRDPEADSSQTGPLIRVKVCFGRSRHHISIKAHSTFGELKKALVENTGLQTKQQRLLYKGKEKKDSDYLFEYGVKDKSKIILVEDAASWEKRLVELRKNEAVVKACKAVAETQQTVDKLSGQVVNIEDAILSGKHLSDNELTELIDSLMCQLVILDANKVEGDTNVQKTILIRRVQRYVEKLDSLQVQNDRLLKAKQSSNVLKIQSDVSRGGYTTAGFRNQIPPTSGYNTSGFKNQMPPTAAVKTWESFGANLSLIAKPLNQNSKPLDLTPKPPVASEPLLIQWD